jgi:hypothetical protein
VLLKKKKRTKEREIYIACTYGTGRCLGGTTLLMLFSSALIPLLSPLLSVEGKEQFSTGWSAAIYRSGQD